VKHWNRLAVLAVLPFAACVTNDQYRDCLAANDALQKQIADMKQYQGGLEAENKRLADAVAEFKGRVLESDYLRTRKEELERLLKQLQGSGIAGVSVRETPEGIAFDVQGEVLFDSGKDEITAKGRETLQRLVVELKRQDKRLRIDGHTDSDPIRHSSWKTNLRLSVARSLSVAEFLTSQGYAAEKIAVAGFGEHRPTVSGDSDEAKRQNRRVEILMLK
jgi:chemotaxis protein MotB